MSVRSGQSITTIFPTSVFSTGALGNATGAPAGTLYVNGVSNAAVVTVTNLATGLYSAQVTLPTLAVGDWVAIFITATVNGVAAGAKVWEDTSDMALDAAGKVTVGTNSDKTGYSLTQAFPANFASLTIDSSGRVSSNMVAVNGATVKGAGTPLSPWGPV